MIERYKDTGVTWVDLCSPSPEEIRAVMEEYNVPPQLVGDLGGPVPRAEATASEHAIKITIDFPVVKRKDVDGAHEIKFIISKRTLITVRYEEITAMHKFAKEFEVITTLKHNTKDTHGGSLFIALMGALYDGLASKLDYIESRLVAIEQGIFDEREREMVFEISRTSQTLITFRQMLFSHKEVLEMSRPLFERLFESDYNKHIDELLAYYQYLSRRVASSAAALQELRDTNDSLLSTKQNEIMKNLTVMAFITFPLTLISSIFAMDATGTPIVSGPYGFWMISGIMVCSAFLLTAYFRYKRWF